MTHDGVVVGFFDVVVHLALVGLDAGATKNVVYLEIEKVLVVGGSQGGGGVVEVATHHYLLVFALLDYLGNGFGLCATDVGGQGQFAQEGFRIALQLLAFGHFQYLFVELSVGRGQSVGFQVAVYQQNGIVVYLQFVGHCSIVEALQLQGLGRKDGVFGVTGKGAGMPLLAFTYLVDAVVLVIA